MPECRQPRVSACPAAQCNAGYGGNPNLKPETSDTKSFGLVFTPTFIDGFTATIDYFDIKVQNYISSYRRQHDRCPVATPPATRRRNRVLLPAGPSCQPAGTIYGAGYVNNIQHNLPYLSTSGIDFEANYQTDIGDWGLDGWGGPVVQLRRHLARHAADQDSSTDFSSDLRLRRLLRRRSAARRTPKWRHKLRVTWSSPWDFDVSLLWRHLSGVNLDANTNNPLLAAVRRFMAPATACAAIWAVSDCLDNHVPAFDYFDLSGTWTVREGVQLRAGVTNMLRQDAAGHGQRLLRRLRPAVRQRQHLSRASTTRSAARSSSARRSSTKNTGYAKSGGGPSGRRFFLRHAQIPPRLACPPCST